MFSEVEESPQQTGLEGGDLHFGAWSFPCDTAATSPSPCATASSPLQRMVISSYSAISGMKSEKRFLRGTLALPQSVPKLCCQRTPIQMDSELPLHLRLAWMLPNHEHSYLCLHFLYPKWFPFCLPILPIQPLWSLRAFLTPRHRWSVLPDGQHLLCATCHFQDTGLASSVLPSCCSLT